MRILQVSWEYPPLVTGGLAAHVDGISRAMARAGHEVVVLTRWHPDAPDDAVVEGVRVVRAHDDLPWTPPEDVYAKAISANHHLARLANRLGSWRPEVVHAHDWLSAWAGDALKDRFSAPFVATIHATERGRHQGHLPNRMSEAINAAEWWLCYQARMVVCCSWFMVDEVHRSFEVPREKLRMVPNGVDREPWRPDPSTAPASDQPPTIVSWGRLTYEKGFQSLVQAMSRIHERHRDARCVIVGRGPYADDLRRLAEHAGVAQVVELPGFLPDDSLKRLLNGATCAVIPSFYEPFGIVALEALAAGAPLVAAASGGLREVLDGTGAGLLYPPGDHHALADAVLSLLDDPHRRAGLREVGDRLVTERYSWDAIAAATVEEYQSVR